MGCSQSVETQDQRKIDQSTLVVDFIAQTTFFKKIKDRALLHKASLCFDIEIVNVPSSGKTPIIKRGQVGDSFYIVAKGAVEVSTANSAGQNAVLRRLGKNDVFMEIGFLHAVPSTVDMYAVSDSVLLKLKKSVFQKNKSQKFMHYLNHWLEQTASDMVIKALRNVPMLAGVSEDQLALMAKMFDMRVVTPGQAVFKEGDVGDAFYILSKGKLVVTTTDEFGLPVELKRLKKGATFGEISLVDDQPRTATITALEESTLFALSSNNFKSFLKLMPELAQDLEKSIKERSAVSLVANRIPFLQSLGPNKLHLLSTVSTIVAHEPGEVIMVEGRNIPAKFFIITKGNVEVTVQGKRVRDMTTGEYFGEISLVSGQDATATVTAKDKVVCLEVTRENFDALFVGEAAALAEIQIKILGERSELKHVLNHPIGREYFSKYSEKSFAVENIEFWTDVEAMERMGQHRLRPSILHAMGVGAQAAFEQKRSLLRGRAKRIFQLYIDDDAEKQVNIKSAVREKIKRRVQLDDIDYDLYNEAKAEIYDLMDLDIFSRFKKNELFTEMLQKIGIYGELEDVGNVKHELDQRSKSLMEEQKNRESERVSAVSVVDEENGGDESTNVG